MQKIKPFITNWIGSDRGKDILIVLIVVLVGTLSFELGRLSKGSTSSGIKIEYPNVDLDQEANAISSITDENYQNNSPRKISETKKTSSTEKNFFASNRGNKYYGVGCAGGEDYKRGQQGMV